MEKVTGHYTYKLIVTCPYCRAYFDILDRPEYQKEYYKKFNLGSTQKQLDQIYTCPACKKKFILEHTEEPSIQNKRFPGIIKNL